MPARRAVTMGLAVSVTGRLGVTPPGNADGYEFKGLAEKAIRKNMKTKERQGGSTTPGGSEQAEEPRHGNAPPHPRGDLDGCEKKGVAGKGICKSMKTKEQRLEVGSRRFDEPGRAASSGNHESGGAGRSGSRAWKWRVERADVWRTRFILLSAGRDGNWPEGQK